MKGSFFKILSFLFVSLIISFSSCRLPSEELSPEEMDIVDTLYNARIPLFRKELDSVCTFTQDSMVQIKTDSLVELQLIEIRKLVKRQ